MNARSVAARIREICSSKHHASPISLDRMATMLRELRALADQLDRVAPSIAPLAAEAYVRGVACVRREITMRERVYPAWVAKGRMKQADADREIEAMRGVLDTLLKLQPDGSHGTGLTEEGRLL